MSEKLTETYSLRITPTLKEMADTLTSDQRHDLNKRIRIEIARAVHVSRFDPRVYLEDNHD